jgi:hypothetical protein
MSAATKLAKTITIEQRADPAANTLKIDGEEFPWAIDGDVGITTTMTLGDIPAITITIPTDRLEILYDIATQARARVDAD